ncbi:MAG: polyribonucleotide nucleotidyltransferase [Bacillota bacterium]
MQPILRKSLVLADREITMETGRFARQAGGAVLVGSGDTVVLVTATASAAPREGIDFFPLTVDYEERLYAAGKIPGGFIKREGRPSEKAILSARLIDRPIRPLFPKNYRNDVHIVATVLSVDQNCPPDVLAIIGASSALAISEIPFLQTIGAVIVGLIDGQIIINPTLDQAEKSSLHLAVAGTSDAVMMVEAGAKEVPEPVILDAIMTGHDSIKKIVRFIDEFRDEALSLGLAKPKSELAINDDQTELEIEIESKIKTELLQIIKNAVLKKWKKQQREAAINEIKDSLFEQLIQDYEERLPEVPDLPKKLKEIISKTEKAVVRELIIRENLRVDGRGMDEVRPISCEVGVLPRTHGSGVFVRGETQILNVATLGAVGDEQILDGLGVEESKRYMHHYNFPPYSVGEARPMRGPGRREIGHGALAERALEPVLPSEEEFPYTIRLVSEVLGSNGSTSMGSVCASTLSLMDAGVPIKAPVSGVAMGLIKDDTGFAILTDIQGIEDALGDMDFKVAGTAKGITALQMDIKIQGIDENILSKALEQAYRGRMHIMQKMLDTIQEPRKELSPYAPRIIRTVIDPDKIRDIIGPGGKIIKKIIEETGVEIDIEDDGRVFIAAVDQAAGQKAMHIIECLTQEVQVGKTYVGKVTRTTDFGAFVEVIPGVLGVPGKEGLVHISQLAEERVGKVEDVVREGDEILVKAIGFDQQGRLKLSRKEALRAKK